MSVVYCLQSTIEHSKTVMQMNLFVYDENMMCQSAMKVVLAIESGYHRRIAAIISLTNRFHVAVRLSGNRPQMTSICGARVFR